MAAVVVDPKEVKKIEKELQKTEKKIEKDTQRVEKAEIQLERDQEKGKSERTIHKDETKLDKITSTLEKDVMHKEELLHKLDPTHHPLTGQSMLSPPGETASQRHARKMKQFRKIPDAEIKKLTREESEYFLTEAGVEKTKIQTLNEGERVSLLRKLLGREEKTRVEENTTVSTEVRKDEIVEIHKHVYPIEVVEYVEVHKPIETKVVTEHQHQTVVKEIHEHVQPVLQKEVHQEIVHPERVVEREKHIVAGEVAREVIDKGFAAPTTAQTTHH
eukprot:TRINITY_DN1101_c0_g1_i1.p1 TRINITY_DN1101_c0_g1~~TRINITY_DN1101_c0_g1_i1.p1  ORF type:complete len:290 (-),score=72.78 TRINITY_DN1101_c0_g1_i1:52-873(-)